MPPLEPRFLTAEQLQLFTLLAQLAVVASVATMLARYRRFRRILLTEKRDWPERLVFAAAVGVPLTIGVVGRIVLGYNAADLSLAGPFLVGLIAGPYAGAIVGVMVGLPGALAAEHAALPFSIGCGFAGGGLREICPKEAIWHFSPFVFTGLHRYAWQILRRFQINWQVLLIAPPVLLELLRQWLGHRWPGRLFVFLGEDPFMTALIVLETTLCVAIPIKIWNSARIEHRLQEQEQLLMTARIEALASQINPHFLFNTLTSISSLIRSQPETARMLIVKLSGLLRRLLKSRDHFVTLREEMEAIDEYLDIECVRFGPNLTVTKEIGADALDLVVPSLILQPLVENSIRHGLAGKVGGGTIIIRAIRQPGRVSIEVIDNGVGMDAASFDDPLGGEDRLGEARLGDERPGDDRRGRGIGLRNVNERLRVIYGASCQLRLLSVRGEGTSARLEIPDIVTAERISA